MKKFYAWVGRNERHLSTLVFIGSFIVDIVSYTRIDLPWVGILLSSYVVLAATFLIVNHALHRLKPDAVVSGVPGFIRSLTLFIAQFAIGGLLSGCLIFYTKSASIFTSWPFIIFLLIVFLGSEFLRTYKNRLTFQLALYFTALYAYAIFAVPMAQGAMGSVIFVESGIISVIIFGLLLAVLAIVSWKRLKEGLERILISSSVILVLVNLFYFTGVLPPLPLSLRDAGVYHSVMHTTAGYEVEAESSSQNPFAREIIHHVPGTPLYTYSAVFAPVKLSTPIVHNWEKFNDISRKWESVAKVAFEVSGGREGGYRGYTMTTNVTAGAWRVSIGDTGGAQLGTMRFDVEEVNQAPILHTEIK